MNERDSSKRDEIIARMAQSRAEICSLLDPPRETGNGIDNASINGSGGFPRSRTMKMLLSSRGLGAVGALGAGLLMARPALALRLLKMVPASAIAKLLISRTLHAFKKKPQDEEMTP